MPTVADDVREAHALLKHLANKGLLEAPHLAPQAAIQAAGLIVRLDVAGVAVTAALNALKAADTSIAALVDMAGDADDVDALDEVRGAIAALEPR